MTVATGASSVKNLLAASIHSEMIGEVLRRDGKWQNWSTLIGLAQQ